MRSGTIWSLFQMKREIDILTTDECHALLTACSSKAPTGIRNQALIVVLWRVCLRIQEALDLRPKDFSGKSIRIHSGKGGRARTVGVDPESSAVIQRWLAKRRDMGFNPSQRLFCTLKGGPVDTSYCRHLFKRLAKKAGLDKRVHPHGLRHSGAVHLLDRGQKITVIAKQLGHSNLATTNTYLNHLKPADVVAAMQSRPGWSGDQKEPDKVQELMNQSDEQLGALMRQFLQSQ
jgi:site-specific recombinase XerD